MKNKSISKTLAVLLSCVLFISSNAVYVYAEPSSNESESECETVEFITEYEETASEEICESEGIEEKIETESSEEAKSEVIEEPKSATIELESEIEETTQSDGTEESSNVDICSETEENTDASEPDNDWKQDAATGIQWKISKGILTVNYKGFLEADNVPWADISEDVKILILQEGITGFSEDVTYDLPNLTKIQIPASCTNIEDVWSAFDFNDQLEKIDVSSGNSKFSSVDGVLYNESGEKLLFYPHNKPDEAFTLPDACTEIDDLYSNKVKELNLGSNLKTINSFVGGENITIIRIPATLQNIGGAVFDVTEKLSNIIIDTNNPYLCYEIFSLLSKDKKIIYEVMPCNSTT
ncbi:MAG: leucine-rich repeat protein, partial [Lachnospiraceae bacterium]|nr:leucine-rich repeat protein [Lachnospiraceae bacterium]